MTCKQNTLLFFYFSLIATKIQPPKTEPIRNSCWLYNSIRVLNGLPTINNYGYTIICFKLVVNALQDWVWNSLFQGAWSSGPWHGVQVLGTLKKVLHLSQWRWCRNFPSNLILKCHLHRDYVTKLSFTSPNHNAWNPNGERLVLKLIICREDYYDAVSSWFHTPHAFAGLD